jgi:hypothetical protein
MPIFLSQGGFVIEQSPDRPTICLRAIFQTTINLKAVWIKCMVNTLYLPLQSINVPVDNDAYLVFGFQDENGALEDLTGATEIEFVVFESYGGAVEFSKTLSNGDIVIAGNDYQFAFWINAADTSGLTNRLCYHECQVTNSAGRKRTVSAGVFRAEYTYIGDIV